MSSRSLVTMSKLATFKWGRFGNQIFQYAFLRLYAKEHNLRIQTNSWVGQQLFGHADPPVTVSLPSIIDTASVKPKDSNILKLAPKNVNIMGFFVYHTSFYAKHKKFFRSLYKPVSEIERVVRKSIGILRSRGKTIIGLHLRREDHNLYTTEGPKSTFFIALCKWYLDWLEENWDRFEDPVLFIASDDLDAVEKNFAKYHPVTNKQLGVKLPSASFYPDFYTLSHCDVLCISNSSFSFAASMLNEECVEQYRPRLLLKKLIPYRPWHAHVVLRHGYYNDLII